MAGAVVTLLDREGNRRAEAIADSMGHFLLAPPEPGEYMVQAVQYGYETTRSPLLSLSTEGSVPLELMMRAVPIGLPGLEVTVEELAEEFLRPLGHTPASLGSRWIDREDIESLPLPQGPGEVIKWRAPAGVWVDQRGGGGPFDEFCVMFPRSGSAGCAMVLLNGIPISPADAQGISPEAIEAMAILRPSDAATFYGTQAGNGVVLIWTRSGGR